MARRYVGFIKGLSLSAGLLSVLMWYQNCGRSALDGMDSSSVLGSLDFTEDDLFLKLQNGQATVSELNYSLSRYQEFLGAEVAAMNSVGATSGRTGVIPIGDVLRELVQNIESNVVELRRMLFDQRMATNSPDVLKKYTELVDLLSRARDVNNYLILIANIGEVRSDVARNRQDLLDLRRDFNALQNSLNEVRNVILPALKSELENKINQVSNRLDSEVRAREASISDLQSQIRQVESNLSTEALERQRAISDLRNQIARVASDVSKEESERVQAISALNTELRRLEDQISAESQERRAADLRLREDMDRQFLNLRNELNSRIDEVNDNLSREIEAVRIIANSNLTLIRGIQESVIVLNNQVRETSDQLRNLSDRITQDISSIQSELERIRTEGNANYAEMVNNWQCSQDMIDRGGFEFYGSSAFTRLGLSVSQACIQQKEDVLYAICTERYPAFCGACRGYTRASSCPAWNAMSGRDRLEILLNIRQEVAIHYLNEQSRLQATAIYGGASCKVQCLTGVNDPQVTNLLGNLINPNSNTQVTCGQDEWKNCGLYGVTYSLAMNDLNLANRINQVNINLSTELAKLRTDFEAEKRSVASRFGILETELNQRIDQLKQVTESRFLQIAKNMAGLSTASGPELAQNLANRSAYLAELASRSAARRDLVIDAVARAMNVSNETAKAALNERDKELIDLLANGIAISSFDVLTEIFKSLNPNQNNRPFYDLDFQNRVAPSCSGHVRFTPFTNIVGRDTHEILAIAYMRLLLSGVRSNQAANNIIFFNQQGVVSGNSLQQVILARLFDYRANPETEVAAACLNAIDDFARDILLNDGRFANHRLNLSQNMTLQRMATILVDDAKKTFDRAGAIHAVIVSSPNVNRAALDSQLLTLSNRVVDAAIAQRMFNLVNSEVENMIAIQKELSSQNGFQSEFDRYLLAYRDSMAAMRTAMEADRLRLTNAIAEQQRQNQQLAGQIGQLRDAMGYVAALAMTDPLASEDIKRRVSAAATVDSTIQSLINQINSSGRNQAEQPFSPVIRAIRHVTQGNVQCFGTQVNAAVLPSGSAFVGHWGISNTGNAPWFPGDSCAFNFRNGSQFKDSVIYRVWGSAHKIEYRSTINASAVRTVDFREPASNSPIRRVAAGEFKQGVFDAQVPGILDPVVAQGWAYNTGVISMTPIYVAANGAETRGTSQTYSMTLYSPLVLDFINKGRPQLISPSDSKVQFDLAATGFKQTVGWVEGRQGGLLALDLNGNNKIDDGSELFGQFTKLHATGLRAQNGYEALKQYDMNRDGVIDSKDPIFHRLVVWSDHNINGISEGSEVVSLAEAQVTGISIQYRELPLNKQFANGNQIRYQAKFFGPKSCDPSGCNSYDVYFGTAWQDQTPKILSQK